MSEEITDLESFSDEDLDKIRNKYFNSNLKGLIDKVSAPQPHEDGVASRDDVLKNMHELFYKIINLRYLPDGNPSASAVKALTGGKYLNKNYDYFKREILYLLNLHNRIAGKNFKCIMLKYTGVFTNESFIMMTRLFKRLHEMKNPENLIHYTPDKIIIISTDISEFRRMIEKESIILDNSLAIIDGTILDFL